VDEQTTAQRLYRSAVAATLSQLCRVAVTFGTRLVLRRLVDPADWGVWDWALAVFLILGAVRDLGLVYHVVRVQPRPYGNLLAVEAVWGGVLTLATVVGAPLLAQGFSEPHPDVVGVLRWLGLFLLLDGLASVPRVYFESELEIGRAVVPELLRNLAFAVTSILLAQAGCGVWSLVAAHVGSTALYAAHLWLRAWGRMPLVFERGRTGALVRGSLPLALIWFLLILVQYVDRLILGARFGAALLGNYGLAYETAFMTVTILQPAVARALYPALAALRQAPAKMLEAYRLATLLISAVEVPAACFLMVNAELAVRILGGGEWVEAPTFLRLLALAPLVDPFTRLGGEVLKVRDGDRLWILATTLTLMSFAVVGWLATGTLGPRGMALTNFLPLGMAVMVWALRRLDPTAFSRLLGDLAWIYLPPVLPFAAAWFAAGDHLLLRLVLSATAVAVCLALSWWRFGSDFVAFARDPASSTGGS
jgi:PST family polysaccharide transporter